MAAPEGVAAAAAGEGVVAKREVLGTGVEERDRRPRPRWRGAGDGEDMVLGMGLE